MRAALNNEPGQHQAECNGRYNGKNKHLPAKADIKKADQHAAAPTANQTETSAVVAASTMMNATMATSHKIVSNHMGISFQGQKAAL